MTDDAQSAALRSSTRTQPDDVVARRIRRAKDNRLGGADYVHVAGQLSIYDLIEDDEVTRVHSAGPAGA